MALTSYVSALLRSQTFWAAVQSIAAVLGLIGLFFYTLYTKRMMKLQLETRRAEIAPEFTLKELSGSSNVPPARNLHITVWNIGKGPALRLKGWFYPVESSLRLDKSKFLPRRATAEDGDISGFEVLPGALGIIVFQRIPMQGHLLCVIECEDAGRYKHQFQLIRIPEPAAMDPWLMVHGRSS